MSLPRVPPTVRPRGKVLVALVAVVATSAVAATVLHVMGGLKPVASAEPSPVAAGEPVDVGPADMSALRWTVRDDVDASALEDAVGAVGWLAVEVAVTATTDATTTFPDDALDLPADVRALVTGEREEPRVMLLADGSRTPDLQPGLTAVLLLLWPVTADPGATELPLTYVRSTLTDSRIDASRIWRVDGPAATTSLPRDDDTGAYLAEPENDDDAAAGGGIAAP